MAHGLHGKGRIYTDQICGHPIFPRYPRAIKFYCFG